MAPDLDHLVVYGTAGLASTWLVGAYLALPLCFGKLFLTAPDGKYKMRDMIFQLVHNSLWSLMVSSNIRNDSSTFWAIDFPSWKLSCPPKDQRKGAPVYWKPLRKSWLLINISPNLGYSFHWNRPGLKRDVIITDDCLIHLSQISEGGVNRHSTSYPLGIPWFHLRSSSSFFLGTNCLPRSSLPPYASEPFLFVGNLIEGVLISYPKITIAYVQLLSFDKIGSISACGLLKGMGLPNTDIFSYHPSTKSLLLMSMPRC